MQKRWLLILILAALAVQVGWAQGDASPQPGNSSGQQPANGSDENPSAPAPAFGQPAGSSISENPPISGLDQPSLEAGSVARSFLVPGVIISQSADTNIPGDLATHDASRDLGADTRVMGSLTLKRLWSRYETDFQYLGGGIFYEGVNHSASKIEQGEFAQRVAWRTGQLAFRDSVSYLPEGTFGQGSYGGAGALQAGLAGLGTTTGIVSPGMGSGIEGNLSAGQFGSLGQEPRLTNSAAGDLVETLTPRSTITAAGSYGFVHFTDNLVGLVDSTQASAQAGYDRQINRTDQIAVTYAFQNLNFPQFSGSSVTTNAIHLVYGHRLSGRMDFVAGAGPQFTQTQSPDFPSTTKVSASGNLRLRYRFSRSSMQADYKHYNTNGSGYFLGATSDVASLSLVQPLGRLWELNGNVGFAHNKHLSNTSALIPATSDQYFFAGAAAHRHVGRNFRLFLSYQYDRFSFNSTVCESSGDCGRTSNRQMGALGFEWYPRPLRLD